MQVNTLVDYSTHLVPDVHVAIDFREWLGGEHKINEYSRALAIVGGKHLADCLGTNIMDPDGDLTFNMVGERRLPPQCSLNVPI